MLKCKISFLFGVVQYDSLMKLPISIQTIFVAELMALYPDLLLPWGAHPCRKQ